MSTLKFDPPKDKTNPLEAYRAEELFTPVDNGSSTAERLDPFWDKLWASGSTASWSDYDSLARNVASGIAKMPKAYRMSADDAWEILRRPRFLPGLLKFLAVLSSWRTITGEQGRAMSGFASASDPTSEAMSALFRLGIVEIGSASTHLHATADAKARAAMYRIGKEEAIKPLLDTLTYAEWVGVTGGLGWERGGQFDRHNILATEFGARACEFLDTAGALGEKFCRFDSFAGTGIGMDSIPERRSADLCILRPDGLRIAVEVTSSTGQGFERKVEQWAQLIAERPMNDSGFMVLFLIAPPLNNRAKAMRFETFFKINNVLRRFPGTAKETVAGRFAVASWTEFFPGRHLISDRFLELITHQPTGDLFAGGDAGWEERSLLAPDTLPFTPNDWSLNAIMDNIHLLWQTPEWMRVPEVAPDLTGTVLAFSDGDSDVPYPAFQRAQWTIEHGTLAKVPAPMSARV